MLQKKKAFQPKATMPYQSLKHKSKFSQRAADKLTYFCGTWAFIFILLAFVLVWMAVNIIAWVYHWDPYPFILLNFFLSCLATIQAPIILMSQRRGGERDRQRMEYTYRIDRKAEREIQDIQRDLEEIKKLIIVKKR